MRRWKIQGGGQKKREAFKEEVRPRSGEWFEEARHTGLDNGVKIDCWARIFSWFREYNLELKQGMQEGSTEEEEMKQQKSMNVIKDMTRKSEQKKERMQTTVGGPVNYWLPTATKRGSIRDGKIV